MGLGMQLVAWPNSFCEGLAARGFRVVRFDNRDSGLSSRMPSAGRLATRAMMMRALFRLPVRPPYTLDDMAADTVGLLDALGIVKAHVVGASMGGMIAQIVAIEHPERFKSLTSISSTSGDRTFFAGDQGNVLRSAWGHPRSELMAIRRGRLSSSIWSAAPAIRQPRSNFRPRSRVRALQRTQRWLQRASSSPFRPPPAACERFAASRPRRWCCTAPKIP